MRAFAILLAALALLSPVAAPALPTYLTINDEEPVRVRSAAAVRRLLARCLQEGACQGVSLESCDRCTLTAIAEQGGYSIVSRLGPPGPEFQYFDNRPRREGTHYFMADEMIEIFASYMSGRDPSYVGTSQLPDPTQ